jgi:hypothetical protein
MRPTFRVAKVPAIFGYEARYQGWDCNLTSKGPCTSTIRMMVGFLRIYAGNEVARRRHGLWSERIIACGRHASLKPVRCSRAHCQETLVSLASRDVCRLSLEETMDLGV